MTADHELLELAAKACGFYIRSYLLDPDGNLIGLEVKPHKQAGRHTKMRWKPLVDDGDALRLVVRLRLQVAVDASGCVVYRPQGDRIIGECQYSEVKDLEVAARLAITRAAAEIGKAMP